MVVSPSPKRRLQSSILWGPASIGGIVLFPFIKNLGWREAANAVLGATIVGFLVRLVALGLISVISWLLAGCAGLHGHAEYQHISSIPEYRDMNTMDALGFCLSKELVPEIDFYSPKLEACAMYELTKKPVFGHKTPDVSGVLRLQMPLF
jgi:hypothetical protein